MAIAKVVLLSPEPWDEVWRRNQHLVAELIRQGEVQELVFVEPARYGPGHQFRPLAGVRVIRPSLFFPRRAGGIRLVAAALHRGPIRGADLLWVNDARLGLHCLSSRVPAFYDVTDDWREARLNARALKVLINAEDALTRTSRVVVCSEVLQQRWRDRYGVIPPIVQNGVDRAAYRTVTVRRLAGEHPHVGYVGTLHGERLDLELVRALALDRRVGTVHLVGPDSLTVAERARLVAHPSVVLHGPVPAKDVPQWLVSLDVLICPHLVSPFTMSLDGIKAHEYLASGRPIVATPTSGFQLLLGQVGVQVVPRREFVDAVVRARPTGVAPGARGTSWSERAAEFAAVLKSI